jgi:hypothetical protein
MKRCIETNLSWTIKVLFYGRTRNSS